MATVRNNSIYFSDMIPIDLSGDVVLANCIGLYITTGGVVKFETVAGGVGATRTVTFPDNTFVPGLITKVLSAGNGTTATGIHALV